MKEYIEYDSAGHPHKVRERETTPQAERPKKPEGCTCTSQYSAMICPIHCGHAVAPVETPRCPFGYTKEMPGTKHDCAIHKSSDYDVPTRLTAEQFIEARLVPLLHGDEAHQDWLRGELRKWIPDLEAFRDKSEAELRETVKRCLKMTREADELFKQEMRFRRKAEAELAALLRKTKGEGEKC